MDTVEIETLTKRFCGNSFQGVFSVDTLPPFPSLLVCNTDPSYEPGEHWIAIYVDSNSRGEYFDPLGLPPNEDFEHYMDECCARWIYNSKQLQDAFSSYCGYYCCFYCAYRCRGFDLRRITNWFTRDTVFNDTIVHGFILQ